MRSYTIASHMAKMRFVIDHHGCWIWTGATTSHGYGHLYVAAKHWSAPRLAYTLFVGQIPPRMEIDHLCRNRLCVNPAHLEPVTTRTNLVRGSGWSGRNAQKTHCKHGHPFDEHNTRIRHRGHRRHRYCRECNRLAQQALRKRHA